MKPERILYQFSRSTVEQCDFSHFLSLYAPDKLPTGGRLRAMMSKMMFGIEGWDADPREILSIPEIRRFYAAFHQAWPYWLYFCNLDTEAFQMMVMCCLPSIEAIKVDGTPNIAVNYNPRELLHFIVEGFGPMNVMCNRAEMSERLIYDRSKALFEYFELPFDGGPPPE